MFSDFEDGGEMWTGRGPREVRLWIDFPDCFKSTPTIITGLAMFDMDISSNQRGDLSHAHVSPGGFELVFRTWGDSRIARIRADWTAIGEVADDDEWQLY